MYGIIRTIFACLLIIASAFLVKRMKINNKKRMFGVLVGVSIVLMVGLSFVPFENLFVTFNSPEAAYEYYYEKSSSVDLVVEGENCDLVIDRENEKDTFLLVPKTTNGWKVGIGTDIKRVHNSFRNGIAINVYQYKNTNDYFIFIIDSEGGKSEISDNYGTEFSYLENSVDSIGKTYVEYFGHIPEFDDGYSVVVNGERINLETDK